jgi:hypothetical protein
MRVEVIDHHLGRVSGEILDEINEKALALDRNGADDWKIKGEVHKILFRRRGMGKRDVTIIR